MTNKILCTWLLCIAALTGNRPAHAETPIPGVPTDKAAHFGVSALGTATTIRALQYFEPNHKITWTNRLISSAIWLGLGLTKEIADANFGEQGLDQPDLEADTFGVIYGNVLMIEF